MFLFNNNNIYIYIYVFIFYMNINIENFLLFSVGIANSIYISTFLIPFCL